MLIVMSELFLSVKERSINSSLSLNCILYFFKHREFEKAINKLTDTFLLSEITGYKKYLLNKFDSDL